MLLFNRLSFLFYFRFPLISIHLMLLFNEKNPYGWRVEFHFNTSNVTIQRYMCGSNPFLKVISIHLMLLFNLLVGLIFRPAWLISIHLMLLFNGESDEYDEKYTEISIHLMLLFNQATFNASFIVLCISIHLMLLFNEFLPY